MGQFKGTLFFVGESAGWTESYYVKGSMASEASASLLAILTPRLDILQAACGVVNATVSDTTIRGDSTPCISVYQPGTYVDAGGYLELNCALLIKWQAGSFNRCKTFLHGLGTKNFAFDQYAPFTGFAALLNAYMDAVALNAVVRQLKFPHATPPVPTDYEFATILTGAPNTKIARRKIGRPFGLPRGRRLAG
jgi:hypothetical protein